MRAARIGILTLGTAWAILVPGAAAQPPPPPSGAPGPPPPHQEHLEHPPPHPLFAPPGERGRPPGDGPFRPLLHDAPTSAPAGPGGAAFRKFISEDVRVHVPLLSSKIDALKRIQDERERLHEDKRRAAAPARARRTAAELERFHDLLKREDALTSSQKALLPAMLRDAPAIRAQVRSRKSELENLIKRNAAASPSAPRPEEHGGERMVPRAIRYYEFLDQRLEQLQSDPNPGEWARPLLKGMLLGPDEHERDGREPLRRQLGTLQEEAKRLRLRLEMVEREIRNTRNQLQSGNGKPPSPPPDRPGRQGARNERPDRNRVP